MAGIDDGNNGSTKLRLKTSQPETDQKTHAQAEDTLRQNEKFMQNVFDGMQDSIFIIDRDMNILRANMVFKQKYANMQPPNGKKCHQVFYSNSVPCNNCPCQRAIAEGSLQRKVVWETDDDGQRRWYDLCAFPLKDDYGNIVGAIGHLREITGRKRAEQLSMRLGKVMDSSFNEIYIIDAQTLRYLHANWGALKNLGYSSQEICSLTPYDINPRLCGEQFTDLVEPLLSGIKSQRLLETVHKRKNGTLYPVEVRIWYSSTELPPVFVANVQDITARRQAEEALSQYREQLEGLVHQRTSELMREIERHKETAKALRESEERYRQLIEYSPYLIIAHSRGKTVFINRAGAELLGARCPEQLIGKPVTEFVHPSCRGIVEKHMRQAQHREGIIDSLHNQKFIRLDGGVVDVEVMAYPITFQGQSAVTLVARDIKEQRRFQKEMNRLENLNLIGQMAAGIAHEIRNPMTTVRGFLQVLGGKQECVQYKEYYDLMISELDRVNSIITAFLSLARVKTADLRVQNLNSIIKVILPLIEADALNADKNVYAELADIPDIPLNEEEIRQLVLNLSRNGLEAMFPGERLTIKTFADGDDVVLAVQDQGVGIAPEIMERLGTPFLTTKDKGTGLGLSVCYSIASRHNAVINAETGPDGTIFRVRFKASG